MAAVFATAWKTLPLKAAWPAVADWSPFPDLVFETMSAYAPYPIATGLVDHNLLSSIFEKRHGLFAPLYSLACFAIFSSPIITGIRLAVDPSVHFWIGYLPWFSLLVPLLLIVCHIYHSWEGRPRFAAVVFSSVVPSLIIIIVAFTVYAPVSNITARLESTDCSTFMTKVELNQAYLAAQQVWTSCLSRVSTSAGMTTDETRNAINVDDCTEYRNSTYKSYQKDWSYLKHLESYQACAGWCEPAATPLWTKSTFVAGTCTKTASLALRAAVSSSSLRMLTMGVVDLIVSVVAVFAINEACIKCGISW